MPDGFSEDVETWTSTLDALRSIIEGPDATLVDLQSAIVNLLQSPAETPWGAHRGNELFRLAVLLGDTHGETRAVDIAREMDERAILTFAECYAGQALPAALNSTTWHVAARSRTHLEMLRQVAVEDLEAIYDPRLAVPAAGSLALTLFDISAREHRFDDYKMAMRAAQMVIDLRTHFPALALDVYVTMLKYLRTEPVFNERELAEREDLVNQVTDFLEPLVQRQVIKTVDPVNLRPWETRDQLRVASRVDFGPQGDTVDRLLNAYRVTGNTVYLGDIVLYCEHGRPRETASERVLRRYSAGRALAYRAVSLHRTSDLESAIDLLREAIDGSGPYEAIWIQLRVETASAIVALAEASGVDLAASVEEVRALLNVPLTLAHGASEEKLRAAARAHAVRARIEMATHLKAASDGSDRGLSNAHQHAAEARRLYELTQDATAVSEAEAFELAIRLLERGCHALVPNHEITCLSQLQYTTDFTFAVIQAVSHLITSQPELHDYLLEDIRVAMRRMPVIGQTASDWFCYELARLAATLVLVRGDIGSSKGETPQEILGIMRQLQWLAAGCGALETFEFRERSDRPIAVAAATLQEAAVQFAAVGDYESALDLVNLTVGVRAGNSLLRRAMGASDTTPVPDPPYVFRCIVVIEGWSSTAVLHHAPGKTWTGVIQSSSLAIAADGRSLTTDVSALQDRNDLAAPYQTALRTAAKLAKLLAPIMRGHGIGQDETCLCLCTGVYASVPLLLLRCVRPEVAGRLITVVGPPTDSGGYAAMSQGPTSSSCGFLLGAERIGVGGAIDPSGDLEALGAAGMSANVFGGPGDDSDIHKWLKETSPSTLHFAGHLALPENGEIVLTLANGLSLSGDEISRLDLRSVSVALLMCCHASASDAPPQAEQATHLVGAFLEAGVKAVIANHWATFQHPAKLFVGAFYSALASRVGPAESTAAGVAAIQNYTVNAVRPFADPLYWGGFGVFTGPAVWSTAAGSLE